MALLSGAVIIVVIVVSYNLGRGSDKPSSSASTQATPSTAPAPSNVADPAPTGCLGGGDRSNAMLLRAQATAPHTPYGAVEVTAAFARWAYRFPYPSRGEARAASSAVVSSGATHAFKDIAASFSNATDITNGQVKVGTPFYLSTVGGRWLIGSNSSPDRVDVSVSATYVVDGVISPTKTAAIAAVVVWESGGWKLLSEHAPDAGAISAGGTAFTAGC